MSVPFKKLGQYQQDMIAAHHLPANFTFNVDPSHLHSSTATRERQVTNSNDVFSFQKCLDQSGNLQPPMDDDEMDGDTSNSEEDELQNLPTCKNIAQSKGSGHRCRIFHKQGKCYTAELQDRTEDGDNDDYDTKPQTQSMQAVLTQVTAATPKIKESQPQKSPHVPKKPVPADANVPSPMSKSTHKNNAATSKPTWKNNADIGDITIHPPLSNVASTAAQSAFFLPSFSLNTRQWIYCQSKIRRNQQYPQLP
ncbi:hypothetical protein EDD15DRAFT_2198393 [Pisolithus albus]|nr:hypothetical protein EDD15DRAFT_2198393 [Pisolithus albus]